jgi:hypothetical protein
LRTERACAFPSLLLFPIAFVWLRERGRSLTDIFRTLRALVQVCQRKPPSVETLLLDDDNPAVEHELLRRTASGQGRGAEGFSWIGEHQKLYGGLRLSWGVPSPHKPTINSPWLKTLTPAHRSALIYKHHKLLATLSTSAGTAAASSQCAELILDLDQSLDRNVQSKRGHDARTILAPCMIPGQVLWVHMPHGVERLMLGREALMIQGYPVCKVAEGADKVTDRFLHDLAGNAMTLQVSLAVVQAAVAALTWRPCGEQPSSASRQDVDDALGLFEQVRKQRS